MVCTILLLFFSSFFFDPSRLLTCLCACSDYNYEIQNDGSCKLVPGLTPADPTQVCRDDPEAIEYYKPTGYRRIPLTTCEGGRELDKLVAHPCLGKDEEFGKKHAGLGGFGLFLAIVIPIGVAGFVGWYAFTRWDGKFGQIQLGDTTLGEARLRGPGVGRGLLSGDSPLIKIPVAVVAAVAGAVVALVSSLPLVGSSLWRQARGYVRLPGRQRPYASRASFAARRGDYAHVVDDEDELLGADEFEDGDEDEEP